LKILIVGLGSIAKKHIAAIINVCPNADIYALRTNIKSETYDNVKNIFSLNEIDFKLDFIVISNITVSHEKTILDMCKFKCPLFIEKPVLHNLDNYKKIAKELEKNSIITYVACNLRFHPALNFLKQYLKVNNHQINEVNIYCGSYLPDWRPNEDFKKYYSSNNALGGGVHLDLIHELDYCTWLFGFPLSSEAIKRNVSTLKIDSYDYAHFSFYYSNFIASITLNYYRRDRKRQIEVITDNQTIIVDLLDNVIIDVVNKKTLFQQQFDIFDTYKSQMKYFIDSILNKKTLMNDFDYSVKVLKLAIYESTN
jgi:predicted dehydrogenase